MLQGIDPVIVINLKTKIAKETGFSALVKNTVDSFLDLNGKTVFLTKAEKPVSFAIFVFKFITITGSIP